MPANTLICLGVIVAVWLLWEATKPPPRTPSFKERFRKLWYHEDTRRLYGEVWQKGVWYEISYCGTRSVRLYDPDSCGLYRFDEGPAWHIGDFTYAVLHVLWWQQNSGDTEDTRRYLNMLLNPDRR